MTTYTLEELGAQPGDIVRDDAEEYEVIDYRTVRQCRSGQIFKSTNGWGRLFTLVSRKGPPKKKGYAKWISEHE